MFDLRSKRVRRRPATDGALLERLVAAIVLIGGLLWVASIFATPDASVPDAAKDVEDARTRAAKQERLPDADQPVDGNDGEEKDEDERDDEDDKTGP